MPRAIDLLKEKLQSGSDVRIKVISMGENLGADFAYFCHFHSLKTLFPECNFGSGPIIDLYRTNVDETNVIGFGNPQYIDYLPVNIHEEAVKQHYYDRANNDTDWVQQLSMGNFNIVSDYFRDHRDYDFVICIGMAETGIWKSQYPEDKIVSIHELSNLLKSIHTDVDLRPISEPIDLSFYNHNSKPQQWSRMALEYNHINDPNYPFTFSPQLDPIKDRYKDYIYISLRTPDYVRWYYSIDQQFDMIDKLISSLRSNNKPVKFIYTLKDGEVGSNFNNEQTIDRLLHIQNQADDVLFHYCWTKNPRRGRPTEMQELVRLKNAGINNILRTSIWAAIGLAKWCKIFLSEPAGFAEIVSSVRRKDPQTTFLWPSSVHQMNIYIIRDGEHNPVYKKINDICYTQAYQCVPTMSEPLPSGQRFVSNWDIYFRGQHEKVGDNCRGDDWKYLRQASKTIFKNWYDLTSTELITAIIEALN